MATPHGCVQLIVVRGFGEGAELARYLRESVWPGLKRTMREWRLDLRVHEIELGDPTRGALSRELRRVAGARNTWVVVLGGRDAASAAHALADMLPDQWPLPGGAERRLWFLHEAARHAELCARLRQGGERVVLHHHTPESASGRRELERSVHVELWGAVRQWAKRTAPELTRGAQEADAEQDALQLAVFHPKEAMPEQTGSLLTYIHEPPALRDVAADAAERVSAKPRAGGGIRASAVWADAAIDRDLPVTVVPQAEGVRFSPPETEIMLWPGDLWQSAEFAFRVSPERAGRGCNGSVTFLQGTFICGTVDLSIYCAREKRSPHMDVMDRCLSNPYRSVFVSYSHDDVAIVELCEHYAEAIGDRYLRDVRMLRAGEPWAERLLDSIDEVDAFQLFWSPRAASSPYVEKEWRHALNRHRREGGFIRPVFWEDPLSPDPPPPLADLHFVRLDLDRLRGAIAT
ncbi:MAG: toll/interleukin-1 receptor domain-containing protein [Armatimonadota bacterium]|nr:toll/interleukin-1 receptor domain-containing protein [Armatimonadota bacterium]